MENAPHCYLKYYGFNVQIGGSKGVPVTFPGVHILLFSCSFGKTIWKLIEFLELALPPRENPDPPLIENLFNCPYTQLIGPINLGRL